MSERTCTMPGCGRPTVGRGFCRTHYQRWWKHGDPAATRRVRGDETARFWSKVDARGPCWEWTAALNGGYGSFRLDNRGKVVRAHRYAWEKLVGPIPEGAELDHLCRNRACVNPDHLEPVTHAENMRRSPVGTVAAAMKLNRDQCRKGHPYDEANTYVTTAGHRQCRTCRREQAQERRRRDAVGVGGHAG